MSLQRGFSIIELLVASSLFVTVVAISAGSFLAALDSSARARELQELSSNLDFALEDMSRNIRVGQAPDNNPNKWNYCDDAGTTISDSCLSLESNETGSTYTLRYRLNNGVIQKSQDEISGTNDFAWTDLTTSDINVTDLTFVVDDAGSEQPRVIINMVASTEGETVETFVIQTSVTQRALDI